MRVWKYLFHPLTATFEWVAVPITTIITSGAGGIISAGPTVVTSTCTLQFNGGLDIINSGSIEVESGGTLLIT